MIIGLTGKNASGKGEAAEFFKKKGFFYFSLSDILREEAKIKGMEPSRENLTNLGNEFRSDSGSNYLARLINKKIEIQLNIKPSTNFVIDSIRSPFEARELMKNWDFVLVGIEAPEEVRFKRLKERNRQGDVKTFEEFKKQEQRENLNNESYQQLDETFDLSNNIIINDGSLEDLHRKLNELLEELKKD